METIQVKAYGTAEPTAPLHEIMINRRALQPHDIQMEVLYCAAVGHDD